MNKPRFESIDIVRGAVMLIMALDHVRHFIHLPSMTDEPTNLATTTPVLFFTRWITHFCAPAFLFLSGISAFISGQRKTKQELSIFLVKRGCWLVLVELIVISFSWSFDPFYNKFFLQVIWAIGWSMIILGLLVRTSLTVITTVGLVLFLGHNILDHVSLPQEGAAAIIWKLLLTSRGDLVPLGTGRSVLLIYSILPWTAVMLLGYVAGHVFKSDVSDARRRKLLLASGAGMILLFIVLRLFNQYGDPSPWSQQKDAVYTFLSFLNVTKYPVSLMYTCMTIGPVLVLLALLKNAQGRPVRFLTIFGRVPFFYYILHFFLIHVICAALFFGTGHTWNQTNDAASFVFFRPSWFGFGLPVVFVVWLLVIGILYYPCRWFAAYKQRNSQWWLSYV
ncbi:MAG TPA: heparan-alpha-glucosaminide N-acetyltransferase domain-containing protein [Chitinophagaceae bacterium]|nr:heparan-alpha-glucosaminide N-acetyltransferase domain-containing protein [Chitinophagaceae bacterium]